MKAYRIRAGRGIDSLALAEEAPAPLGAGQVRLRVRAVSLNFRDLMVADGRYPAGGDRAVIPASDAVAEVIELGPGATRWALGDRVATSFFPHWHAGAASAHATREPFGADADGVLAEQIVVSQESVFAVPAHLDDAQAATLTCAGVTAWNALFVEAGLRPGQSVLLLGTGGVSIWGLQLAKAAGLRAIVTSSSDAKLERARALGADETINYRSHPEWQDEVLRLTAGDGVDAVLEVGGAGTLARSLRAAAMNGTVAIIGGVSGFAGEFDPFALIMGAKRLSGIYVGSRGMGEDLARFVGVNRIAPVVDRMFAFEQAGEAYRYLESGSHFGKVVIRVGG
ncbi:oxidoreductase, zinc-binding dehydrogenase family protein [Lysobacter enzymogenes]|uniref:Oxidoreductase, zinc-binding dehydrogenase family protein n=1 Tax=Lysobacter enzymogenes TaxID=69 RepID=A0A0S2DE50_LYSEN|nr:NAD(P)-dependent alcohol dehydrogenase [Lysobacter enzymogenes]ALN56734.1 oxidoreductase, zinc-binding dehydrogenase family protein [Lysobacter enzymogenes]QCW25501.1 NAD(P)-dependent alcohol dehydrogenase [Lysobacter enzymogenes]